MNSEAARFGHGLALGVLLFLCTCADLERGPRPGLLPLGVDAGGGSGGTDPGKGDGGPVATDTEPAPLSFATQVHALLLDGCEECHRAGGEAGSTLFLLTGLPNEDYAKVLTFVDPDAPAQSRILSKMIGVGHQTGPIYSATSPEYQSTLNWIRAGALP